jgi:hypothetical protein
MHASDIFITVLAIVFILLPPFLFGLAGGLWCWRVRTSILTGLAIGLLAAIMPLVLQSRNPMVLWGATVFRLFLFFVVPAVLGGYVGPKVRLRSIQRHPVGLTVLFSLFGVLGYMLLLPPWSPAREIARQTMCSNNLKQIGGALSKYAQAHDGHLPTESGAKGLDHLLSGSFLNQTNNSPVFRCPWDEIRHSARPGESLTEDTVSYVYAGGGIWQSENYTNVVPVCWDKTENHRNIGVNVLFNDGRVRWLRLAQWNKIKPN